MDLKSILERDANVIRQLGASPGGWIMQTFMVRNGKPYEGRKLPSHYRRDTPKFCFHNSQLLVEKHPRLRYVEGYATSEKLSWMPVHHAWTIDEHDKVVDPTLERPAEYLYLGVVFTPEQIAANISPHSRSLLDTGAGLNAAIMMEIDPELIELIPDLPVFAEHARKRIGRFRSSATG